MRSRWKETWTRLGVAAPPGCFEELERAHWETHRHYHTMRHLKECFACFDAIPTHPSKTVAVELALWFHDAVYDPTQKDNEAKSAKRAEAVLSRAGAMDVAPKVCELVLATRHDRTPDSDEACLLVDVDLSILGAAPSRFEEYERQVRAEYAWVSEADFARARAKLLTRFLERPRIYQTAFIAERLETQARKNLESAIARWSASNDAHRP
jgi:predicted metal-dependent HD superfamily phosphohydrolase